VNNDELLKALADVAREENGARDSQRAALAERSSADREALEANRPLDADARARIVDRILASQRSQPGAGEVIVLSPPKRRMGLAMAAFAVAAALVLWYSLSTRPGSPEIASIPPYGIAISGEIQGSRSEPGVPAETPRFGPGSRPVITLRPATPTTGPIAVRGFLIGEDQIREWNVNAEISENGSFRITGDMGALFQGVPAGRWKLVFAVGRAETLPTDIRAMADAMANDPHERRWQLLAQEVILVENPPSGP